GIRSPMDNAGRMPDPVDTLPAAAPTDGMTMQTPLDSTHLQTFIDAHRLDATILSMDMPTATVVDAARALNVAAENIIKSLLFMADDRPILVINNGTARVDRKKLAAYLGMNRKRVKFASAEEALAISGFVVGSMPPFGHRQPLKTLIDVAAADQQTVYGGGGRIDAMMRMSSADLIRTTRAEIVDLSE
ncbi:MAG TPA: YbaK/EbsC family protein, partial [Desulfosarcina sp.]|nr:YbaK/EbsC family protein [Desulfosarcina sp.]